MGSDPDVLSYHQIVGYLEPLDVLRLSRASKRLRHLLCAKSNRHIVWKRARKNIVPAPPDPPEDLSEPRYASLLFEEGCMVCHPTSSVVFLRLKYRIAVQQH